jgi:hypothetical protein
MLFVTLMPRGLVNAVLGIRRRVRDRLRGRPGHLAHA